MTCTQSPRIRATASDFIQKRIWLQNVTPKTLAWYANSFKAFEGRQTEADFKARIAVSVNTWPRCVNAFLKRKGADFKLPRLKES
jgi:hypothetical protein